jgi:Rrf2 family protein
MKLSDGVEQAIHCVLMLSGLKPDGVLPAQALAEFHGVSVSYLLKHLQALARARIIESVPGPRGGYRLGRSADSITLLDIVLAVDGPEPAFRCAEIRQRGPDPLPQWAFRAPCAINAAMLRAEQAYRAELRKTRIADIFDADTPLGQAIDNRACAFRDLHERRQDAT